MVKVNNEQLLKIMKSNILNENIRILNKILHYTKKFLLKNSFSMFLNNFIFVVSHLKIHPVVHLNTLKALKKLKVY